VKIFDLTGTRTPTALLPLTAISARSQSTKRKHLGITLTKLCWLLGRRSKLELSNKLLIYKVAIKPLRIYDIQLWGAASTSNIEILERFEPKALRFITDTPWYVPNVIIRRDLQVPSVKEEIRRLIAQYYVGLCIHPNLLATQLSRPSAFRRLRRHLPSELPHRFTALIYSLITLVMEF
jgi:hypothetical protein